MMAPFLFTRISVAESYTVQLERVQAAIGAIESGNQSYSILGRSFTKADLQTLYDREAFLRTKVAKEARGGMRVARGIPL